MAIALILNTISRSVNLSFKQYFLKKEELKQLDLKELESVKIRAKAQFLEEGEESTRYFYSLEKARKAGKPYVP